MNEEATRITAEIVQDDPERVSVYFKWNPRVWAHGAQASIVDGEVHLWLHLEDAREFHRKLGEATGDPARDALVAALEEIQVQTQDPAIEKLCSAALPGAQR